MVAHAILALALSFAQAHPDAAGAGTSMKGPPPAAAQPDQTPVVAFPGQYAGRPAGETMPVVPKGCFTRPEGERLACAAFVLADWPRLARFAAANKELAPARPGERRVVFMGDSITDNWSKAGYGGFFKGRPYVNRGIGSQTTAQMLLRFRADVIALKPRAVVILAGTNDVSGNTGKTTPQAIEDNLASMADLARANGIKVILASLLPTSDAKHSADGRPIVRSLDRPPQVMKDLNKWIATYAKAAHHVFLDYHAALVDEGGALKSELTYDGLHPNAAGYALMGPLAEKAIASAIGK
jgi:lysophospholipase L1-like esterase